MAMTNLGRIVAISPHFDDAVFSCGDLLGVQTGSVVTTVFSGVPPPGPPLTDWDRRCGFASGEQAMLARGEENRRALALLGAQEMSLGFLDSQYAPAPALNTLRDALGEMLRLHPPDTVLFPLGLFHEDHIQVGNAALQVRRYKKRALWLAYEDIPYRRKSGLVQRRLAELLARGVCATPVCFPKVDCAKKRHAVSAYASQLAELGHLDQLTGHEASERFWRLEPDGAGEHA